MRYRGGVVSATPPATSTSEAVGVWSMSQQMQAAQAGAWPAYVPPPTTIGQAYGGGFYAGKIAVGGGGVATHYLIVAPKATGENASRTWGTDGVTTGITNDITGQANTTSLNALGSAYQAAQFCVGLNAGSGLNGYTDWYLPAKNELEVLYYFLKPTTEANNTFPGANTNAVAPEPVNQNYTSGSPAQTTATGANGFRTGEANAFATGNHYVSSTELNANLTNGQLFTIGSQSFLTKSASWYVRAVRRVPV